MKKALSILVLTFFYCLVALGFASRTSYGVIWPSFFAGCIVLAFLILLGLAVSWALEQLFG